MGRVGIVILMMMAGVGWGQTVKVDCSKVPLICPEGETCSCESPAPLKCGKYQHEQMAAARCYSDCSADGVFCLGMLKCDPAEDKCVDDMHQVTEREWQLQTESNLDVLKSMEAMQAELEDLRLALAAQWEVIKRLESRQPKEHRP